MERYIQSEGMIVDESRVWVCSVEARAHNCREAKLRTTPMIVSVLSPLMSTYDVRTLIFLYKS